MHAQQTQNIMLCEFLHENVARITSFLLFKSVLANGEQRQYEAGIWHYVTTPKLTDWLVFR